MSKTLEQRLTCQYCKGLCEAGTVKCKNCGAPVVAEDAAHFDASSCPFCKRKLLALASPNCSYCGRQLPEHFLRKREEHLRRIAAVNDSARSQETKKKIDEVLRITVTHDRRTGGSMLDLVNWIDLTDLFS